MNLELILKSNKSIELEYFDNNNERLHFHTLIDKGYNYENNTFTMLAPRKNKVNYPFRHGDILKVFFVDKTGRTPEVYSFKGKIVKKELTNNLVTESIQKITETLHVQRRNDFRFPITKEISLNYDSINYKVLTKNLSSSGLRCVIHKKISSNSTVTIEITLSDNVIITTNALVLSSKLQKDSQHKYNTRIKFLDIDNNEKDKLVNYIFMKQTETLKKLPNSDSADNIYKLLYGEFNEKREVKDIITKLITSISSFSWVMLFLIVIYFLKASPETTYGIGRFFETAYDLTWDQNYLNITLMLCTGQILLTTAGLSINSLRMKRESDFYRKSIIFNLIVGIIMILFTMYLQLR